MSQCVAAIALATAEEEDGTRIKRTRPNVEHEIGLLQSMPNINNRIVYMREPSVNFASNYAEKCWIDFVKEDISDALIPHLRELVGFRLVCRQGASECRAATAGKSSPQRPQPVVTSSCPETRSGQK
jgi:hypothetical protein